MSYFTSKLWGNRHLSRNLMGKSMLLVIRRHIKCI